MNNYQIYEEIGKGRHSTVYKGRRKKSIEYYAIASVDKAQRARMVNGVQLLRSFNHKNILHFHNWYETTNHLWMITELCTGGDLRSILLTEEKLPEKSIRILAADIAEGMCHMHSKGVLYADLKPSNLLLDSTGSLRFYDFGLSMYFDNAGKGESGRVGTPSYMAPELFEKGGVPSMASDMWSFGCVLYELATGRPPFVGDNLQDLISNIVSSTYERPAKMSNAYCDLIEGLLTKNPAQRATWSDVVASEVFPKFTQVPDSFPPQPAFEAYIKANRVASKETTRRQKDVLRASVNAERNLNRLKAIRSDQSTDGDGTGSTGTGGDTGARTGGGLVPGADGFMGYGTESSGAKRPVAKIGGVELDQEMDFRDPAQQPEEEGAESNLEGTGCQMSAGDNERPVSPAQQQVASPPPQVLPVAVRKAHTTTAAQAAAVVAAAAATGLPESAVPSGKAKSSLATVGTAQDRKESLINTDASTPPQTLSTVEELLHNPQDPHLRPLVGNARIERYSEPKYEDASLPFKELSALQLRGMERTAIEEFLTTFYRALCSSTTSQKDKINMVVYFEVLATDSQVAEIVVNCSVMDLFTRLLGSKSTSSALRLAIATVMGYLVRHADVIDAKERTELIPTLVKYCSEEPNARVKRRILACLGELLFFVATRPHAQRGEWQAEPHGTAISELFASALSDPDEPLTHYAAKMIENTASIADLSAVTLFRFANRTIATKLLARYDQLAPGNPKTEHFRVALSCAALKLCLADHSLLLDVLSWPSMQPATFLTEIGNPASLVHNPKTVQSYLTVLIAFVAKTLTQIQPSDPYVKSLFWVKSSTVSGDFSQQYSVYLAGSQPANAACFAKDNAAALNIRADIMRYGPPAMGKTLWESPQSPIRGKAAQLLALLAIMDESVLNTQSPQLIMTVFGGAAAQTPGGDAVLAQLDRLLRDRDVYVRRCMEFVIAVLQLYSLKALQRLAAGDKPLEGALPKQLGVCQYALTSRPVYVYTNALTLSSVVVALSRVFVRAAAPADAALFVPHIASFIALAEEVVTRPPVVPRGGDTAATQVSNTESNARLVVNTLLPSLLPLLPDTCPVSQRYIIVKAVLNLLTPVVSNTALYGSSKSGQGPQSGAQQQQGILTGDVATFMASLSKHVGLLSVSNTTAVLAATVNDNATATDNSPQMLTAATLKLLNAVCENSTQVAGELATKPTIDKLVIFMREPVINVHVLSLLQQLLHSGDAELLRYTVTTHQLLPLCLRIVPQLMPDWDTNAPLVEPLVELISFMVSVALTNPSGEVALSCGHLVAGQDATPLETVLLRVCNERHSSSAAEYAASAVTMLCQLFEEARTLLAQPRVLAQIRDIINTTTMEVPESGDSSATRCLIQMIRTLSIVAKSSSDRVQSDELLLMQIHNLADTCPHQQLAQLARDFLAYVFK